MESYRGIYSIIFEDNFMYADVYVTPENVDIYLDVAEVLKHCVGIEHCYFCQEPVNRRDVTGWVGIRIDIDAKEARISIYGDYNTQNRKTLLDKTFPLPSNSLTVEYNI